MGNIHVIDNKNSNEAFLYIRDTFKIYELNETTKKIFKLYEQKVPLDEIAKETNINEKELVDFIHQYTSESGINKIPKDRLLGAFLLISQDCNLRCQYCYADYGKYGGDKLIMPLNVAKRAIDCLISLNPDLEFIQFFGGEPTLNEECIFYVVDYFHELKKKGVINEIPWFSMVTNLVNISDKLIETIKNNKFSVTVSIDGTEEIHDYLRKDINDNGSYAKIIGNYERLIIAGIIPIIEATYTGYHKNKIKLKQLYELLHKTFVNKGIHISLICCPKEHELAIKGSQNIMIDQKEAIDMYFDRIVGDDPIYASELESIINVVLEKRIDGTSYYRCKEAPGISQFTISAEGDIYACYALAKRKSLKMGSVFELNSSSFTEFQTELKNINKETGECKDCWARYICSICLAGEVFAGNEFGQISKISCCRTAEILEYVIFKLAQIQNNPQLAERFNKNYWK